MERKVALLLSFLSISFLKEALDARLLSRSLRQRSDKPLVGHYCGGRVWSICLPFVFTLYLYLLFYNFGFVFVSCNCCYCRVCLIFGSFDFVVIQYLQILYFAFVFVFFCILHLFSYFAFAATAEFGQFVSVCFHLYFVSLTSREPPPQS